MKKNSFLLLLLFLTACSYSYFNKGFNEQRYYKLAHKALFEQFSDLEDYSVVDTNSLNLKTKKYYLKVIQKHFKIKKEHINSKAFKRSFKYLIPTYYILNKWNKVIGNVDEYRIRYPDDKLNRTFLYYKGLSYLNLGEEKIALEIFSKLDSLSLKGDYMVYFYERLGNVWLKKGSKTTALNYYKKALGFAKNNKIKYDLYMKIADLFTALKRYVKSNEYLENGLEIDKISIEKKFNVYRKMFDNYFFMKNFDKIFSDIVLLEKNSDYGKYYNEIDFIKYRIAYEQKNYAGAETFLLKILLKEHIEINDDSIGFIVDDSARGIDTLATQNNILERSLFSIGKLYFENLSNYKCSESVFLFYKKLYRKGIYSDAVNEYIDKLQRYNRLVMSENKNSDKNNSGDLFTKLNFLIFDMNRVDTAISLVNRLLDSDSLKADTLAYQKLLYTKYYILKNMFNDSIETSSILQSIVKLNKKSVYSKEADRILNINPEMSIADSFNLDMGTAQHYLINDNYSLARDYYYYILKRYGKKKKIKKYKVFFSLAYIYEEFLYKSDSSIYFYNKLATDSLVPKDYREISIKKIKNYNKYKLIFGE